MTDPGMMTDMLKGNVTNVLPMIVIGGWINWMFSGFLTSEFCFEHSVNLGLPKLPNAMQLCRSSLLLYSQ